MSLREWKTLDEWWDAIGEAELRLILWAAWDPIGRVPRDEYDWYVPRLWVLLRDHTSALREPPGYDELSEAEQDEWSDCIRASEGNIAAQLSEWRTERMSLPPTLREDQNVAAKLTDWLSPMSVDEFRPIDLIP